MKYAVDLSRHFRKSLAKCINRGLQVEKLKKAVLILQEHGKLPREYRPHKLKGKYLGCWECHIQPDWLLIWEQNDTRLTLLLLDTGTHSELF